VGGAPKVTSYETGFYDVHNLTLSLVIIYSYNLPVSVTYIEVRIDKDHEADATA